VGRMKYLKAWGMGKPIPLMIAAQQIATGAAACLKMYQSFGKGVALERHISKIYPSFWLSLYYDHRAVQNYMKTFLQNCGGLAAFALDFFESLPESQFYIRKVGIEQVQQEWQELDISEKQQLIDGIKEMMSEFFRLSLEDIQKDLSEQTEPRIEQAINQSLENPEFLFFLRVTSPCWLLYGDYPARMLRKARNGDMDALEKLLRPSRLTKARK